ncbi:MAG: hypothetical protein WDZ44_00600, partial [Candidatus Spechtbacterales bacterium]
MENEYKNESFQPEEITTEEPRGPKFDDRSATNVLYEKIAAAKNNGWGATTRVFVEKNRATLLPLVALIASIALGLGAIAILDKEQAPIQLAEAPVVEEPATTEELPVALEEDAYEEEPTTVVVNEGTLSVTASAGDGITHLARRVITEELSANTISLSAEQLVYAEDYLQNRTGCYGLEVGEEVSF